MTQSKKLNRVCVVGLDGVPGSLLHRLADSGVMPSVAMLREAAPVRQMRVSIPEISAVSWTSFATGANPGVHGIFGFVDLKPNSYELRFPNARDCRARTIWDKVGNAGGRSVVINQPFTYPARPLQGSLVAGFVALDLEKAVYPSSLLPKLKASGYSIDIDVAKCRTDHDLLWRQLDETLESRRKAVELLWDEEWTYFQAVVTGTDRLFHYLWPAIEDETHPQHDRAMEYFRAVDGFVGDVYERFEGITGDEAIKRFWLLSDHGFCGIEQEVYLNRWLQEEGYLSFLGDGSGGLSEINPGSKAFCLDPGRIYIHARDIFPRGSVPAEKIETISEEIAGKLGNLRYKDQPVIRKVLRRDDVYAGPIATHGPDLVALSRYGFDLKGTPAADAVFGRSDLTGMHTWDDAFVLTGATLQEPVFIWDLAEAILMEIGVG